jgi:ribonucleoside-triphosphate reductase
MIKTVIKKNTSEVPYDFGKVVTAVTKSAERCGVPVSEIDFEQLQQLVESKIDHQKVHVSTIHTAVENSLGELHHKVAMSYKDYRNYRKDTTETWDHIYKQARETLYLGDRENANFDSSLNSTKGSLIRGYLTKELYKNYEMKQNEIQAIEDGFIYVHDLTNLLFRQINCCLFDMGNLLKGGFEMSTIQYKEPKSVLSALQVIGDVTLSATAQQFGGFTIPEIDKILVPYVKRSIELYNAEFAKYGIQNQRYIYDKVKDELIQGFQSLEMKLNTVPCSRGDFAFTTLSFGNIHETPEEDIPLQIMISEAILKVRMGGQGKNNRPVVFPKLVYLYSKEQHKRDDMSELFDLAIECSSRAMYPDYLAIDSVGDVSRIFKEHGVVTSPMGCRAYLSEYLDPETGKAIATGRANIGAVSLNLPMIWMKAKTEGEDFYVVLKQYLNMIRGFLLRRYEYLSRAPASTNPLAFTQGGLLGGNLQPDEPIGDLVDTFTASFGITALNELNVLMTGQQLHEYGNSEVKKVVEFINAYIDVAKKEDHRLYALYGTPAESLCGTQLKQFKKMYGVIAGVSNRPYFTNSFHLHVSAIVEPFFKQDHEQELFHMVNGGHIVYNRIRGRFNLEAMKTIVLRGMNLGLYQGVNFDLTTCEDCGWNDENDTEVCPECGSHDISTIVRNCGYLSLSRTKGSTRLNESKLAEVLDRVSM